MRFSQARTELSPPIPVGVPEVVEPAAQLRIRALMLAQRMGWLWYIGPVNPDTVLPTNLTYVVYVLPGPTVQAPATDPPVPVEGLEELHADEVLGFVRGMAVARGYAHLAAWRDGQLGR